MKILQNTHRASVTVQLGDCGMEFSIVKLKKKYGRSLRLLAGLLNAGLTFNKSGAFRCSATCFTAVSAAICMRSCPFAIRDLNIDILHAWMIFNIQFPLDPNRNSQSTSSPAPVDFSYFLTALCVFRSTTTPYSSRAFSTLTKP